ncbi:MFS transporter [Conyzicola nivalis]|uniref:MFS transporter n=2 Tax=Conyzicola nivalis TaxID=1477021 RepID=A0A916SCR6_9MICO|nr:MFS transporter [Conyzicola nivalis]
MGLIFVAFLAAAAAPSPLYVLYQDEWHFPASLLSVAFAVYAFGLLLTLLVVGKLSDYIGRRPVLIAALVAQIVAMTLLFTAGSIELVIVARIIQGLATGAATGALSAALSDLAPAKKPALGAVIASLAPLVGLALGAALTGVVVQLSSEPITVVFVTLDVVFALGLVVVFASPESVSRKAGALRTLIPRVSVPELARREFVAGAFLLIGVWLTAGIYLGLIAQVDRDILRLGTGSINGILITILSGAGALSVFATTNVRPRVVAISGAISLAVGVSFTGIAIAAHSLPLLIIASLVAGIGFGLGFAGPIRLVSPLAKVHERGQLFSAVYVVCYLTFGVPAIVAGWLVGVFTLLPVVIGYAALAAVSSLVGLAAQLRRAREDG